MGNIGYSASKAAFGRVAGGIEAEFGPKGVRGFNVDPGHVVTESVLARHGKDPFGGRYSSDSAEATAAVATWLSTHSEALDLAGDWIYAPELCEERNFLKVLARIRVPQPVDVDVLASAVSGMN